MTRYKFFLTLTFFFLMSVAVMAQDPGGNPDGPPPAVPFDDYMLPLLLVAGLAIVFVLFKKMKRATGIV